MSNYFESAEESLQDRIALRKPVIEDAANLGRWYTSENMTDWLYTDCPSFGQGNTASQFDEAFFKKKIESRTNLSFPNIMYSIYYENVHIGFAMLQKDFAFFTGDADTVSIGLDIPDPALRGRGYGLAVCKKLIKMIHEEGVNGERYSHIYMETLSYNTPAIKLAKKLGFREITRKQVNAAIEQGILQHKEQIERVVGAIEGPYEAIKFRLDF